MAITLNNGIKMPTIGLGVWRMEGKSIKEVILNDIRIGYRHFDCAAKYQNEAEVGEALAEAIQTGIVKREDLFITTKLWNSDHGHVLEACEDSLKKLQLEYLDLYLVHFPIASKFTGIGKTSSVKDENGDLDIDTTISLETTWHAMEGPVSMGLVRSIGRLAENHNKTVAQIILRWGIQRNTVVIPKSSKLERLKENFHVFDFELTLKDMVSIRTVDQRLRSNQPGTGWGIDVYP
ncbi:hypothetical protein IFM89_030272 [Coptis chinensis]|uniref:NADP-dependent oxidoreductase domain-containing protein n=1 Tax=Coptis chinensis TaxID=261450 RepID=A0A835IQW2_9MAGN|nr:hypothetical protein IFM89_030272 [Coptis chinensis]